MDLNSRELIEHPENNFKTNVIVFNILKEHKKETSRSEDIFPTDFIESRKEGGGGRVKEEILMCLCHISWLPSTHALTGSRDQTCNPGKCR